MEDLRLEASVPPAESTAQARSIDATRALQLDVVRGVSIFLVMVTHSEIHPEFHSFLYFPIEYLARVGAVGVDVFFVLSGFLVGGLLMREFEERGSITPLRFFVRRAFKIWPTYYAFLAAYAVATLFGLHEGTLAERARGLWAAYWPNLLHLQNYFARTRSLGPLWSLAVEEHFYLVLPWALIAIFFGSKGERLSTMAIGRRMTASFVGIATVCLVLRILTVALYRPPSDGSNEEWDFVVRVCFATHLRIDSLFAGVYLAYLVRFQRPLVERLRPWRGAILVASVLAPVPIYFGFSPNVVGRTILFLAASGLVVYAHFGATSPRLGRAGGWLNLPMRAFAWLGVRSYAIYVWHVYFTKPVGVRALRLLHLGNGPGLEGWVHDAIMLGADALVGAVMYELIELPGIRLRQRVVPGVVQTPV